MPRIYPEVQETELSARADSLIIVPIKKPNVYQKAWPIIRLEYQYWYLFAAILCVGATDIYFTEELMEMFSQPANT